MKCEYDGKEITGEPYTVQMQLKGKLASAMSSKPDAENAEVPTIGTRYFHDKTCFELFAADEAEYDALDLPGSQIG